MSGCGPFRHWAKARLSKFGESGVRADITEWPLLTHFGPRRFLCGHRNVVRATQGTVAKMKCLRVYSTADGGGSLR